MNKNLRRRRQPGKEHRQRCGDLLRRKALPQDGGRCECDREKVLLHRHEPDRRTDEWRTELAFRYFPVSETKGRGCPLLRYITKEGLIQPLLLTACSTALLPAPRYFLIDRHHHIIPNLHIKGVNAGCFQGCAYICCSQPLLLA
jgi:hypothetical protein